MDTHALAVDAWGLGCLIQEVFSQQYLASVEQLRYEVYSYSYSTGVRSCHADAGMLPPLAMECSAWGLPPLQAHRRDPSCPAGRLPKAVVKHALTPPQSVQGARTAPPHCAASMPMGGPSSLLHMRLLSQAEALPVLTAQC